MSASSRPGPEKPLMLVPPLLVKGGGGVGFPRHPLKTHIQKGRASSSLGLWIIALRMSFLPHNYPLSLSSTLDTPYIVIGLRNEL